ncbi:MAG TPA: class I SAM-dependent methyltransferase, partial [Nonomuraea sp.]|nr:class I SAM-dependent methyltransferase [Nonomuraea sp.]
DIQTGGGEVLAGIDQRAAKAMVATESWPPNIPRAQENLRRKGVVVVVDHDRPPLPFADGTFDLVTSRHPVTTHWADIARVLVPGGTYFSQQVGPRSVVELSEYFLGPMDGSGRDPEKARAAAEQAGLTVTGLRAESLRMEFRDIGAVIYFLRKVIWTVPGFSVGRYRKELRELHERIQENGPFIAHSTRFLIEARA